MSYKYCVLSYKLYVFPAYNSILTSAQKSENPPAPEDNQSYYFGGFGIYLNIINKSYPASVCTVDNLLVTKISNTTAIHKKTSRNTDYFRRLIFMTIIRCFRGGMNVPQSAC